MQEQYHVLGLTLILITYLFKNIYISADSTNLRDLASFFIQEASFHMNQRK